MNTTWKHLVGCAAVLASFQAAAQVQLYEHDNFRGRSFRADGALGDFTRAGFNDRASSVVVRGGRWILCDNSRFGGNCVRLQPGRYASLSAIGLNDRVSSARPDDGSDHGGRYRDRDRDGYVDGRHRDRDRDGYVDGRHRDRDRDGYVDGRYRDRDGRWRDRDGRHIDGNDRDRRVVDPRRNESNDRDRRVVDPRRNESNDRDRRADPRRDEQGLTAIEREVNRETRRRQANPEPSAGP